jgi:predicted anti-sigma-YlaC factor YlaD
MSHQPFETWLLEENNRTPEQEAALQAHLQNCAECRQIQTGWQAARLSLESARMARPAPGFTQRFSASLAERRAQQAHRRQIRNLILGLSLGLIATAILLTVVIFTFTSPVDLLVNGVEVFTVGVNRWNQITHVLSAAIRQPIFLVMWILVTCGVSFLACAWLFSLWRISVQGAHQE